MPRKRKRKAAASTAAMEEAGLVDAPAAETLREYDVTYQVTILHTLGRRVLARSNAEATAQVRAAAETRYRDARVRILTAHLAGEA